MHLVLEEVDFPKGVRHSSANVGRAQSERLCCLEKVSENHFARPPLDVESAN